MKPMKPADAVGWPSILVWYMYIAVAPSVYTVRGEKLLSSALCVCDCSLIAFHILCLWTQTEFSRLHNSRKVSRQGTQRPMERFLSSKGSSHIFVLYSVHTLTKTG